MIRVYIAVATGLIGLALFLYTSRQENREQSHHNQPYPRTSASNRTTTNQFRSKRCALCNGDLGKEDPHKSKCGHIFHQLCLASLVQEEQFICPVRSCRKELFA